MVRDIRDSIYRKTISMTKKEIISYYHEEAKQFHKKLGVGSKMVIQAP